MFGTQIDDSMTVTTPPKANLIVIGTKIYGLQVDPIWFLAETLWCASLFW